MNSTALFALIRNDIRLYLSDRRSVVVGVLVPILIAAFFGYVFGGGGGGGQEAGQIPIAIVDEDQSAVSRAITADLGRDELLLVTTLDRASAREQVRSGAQNAAAIFPSGYGVAATRALFRGQDRPTVEVLVDPSQATGARIVEGLLAQYSMQEISKEAFTGAFGRQAIDDYLQELDKTDLGPARGDLETLLRSARRLNERHDADDQTLAAGSAAAAGERRSGGFGLSIPYEVKATAVAARENSTYNSYAHAFAGMAVQFILFGGIDAGILLLLTQKRGIWQRLRSAPLRRGEFLLARTLATTLISLFQFAVIYLAAVGLFQVRIEGSLPGFLAIAVAFCLLNAAFGLMLATLGKSAATTRGLAMMVTLLLVMVGGAWVPAFVFPKWLQSASLGAPTRWAVDGLDGATWRGLPFDAAVAPTLVLLASAACCLGIAIWRFRWEE